MRHLLALFALAFALVACDDTATTEPNAPNPYAKGAFLSMAKLSEDTVMGGTDRVRFKYAYNKDLIVTVGLIRYGGGGDTALDIYGTADVIGGSSQTWGPSIKTKANDTGVVNLIVACESHKIVRSGNCGKPFAQCDSVVHFKSDSVIITIALAADSAGRNILVGGSYWTGEGYGESFRYITRGRNYAYGVAGESYYIKRCSE